MAGATKEEKLSTGLQHKAEGNAAFGKQNLGEALRCYHLSVLYLTGLEHDSNNVLGALTGGGDDPSSGTESAASLEAKAALSAVHSNMSLIYLKQQKYDRAINAAEKSIKLGQPTTTTKAKYRKAQALRLSGDVYKAKDFLDSLLATATDADADETQALRSELTLVDQAITARKVQSNNKFKGFLSKTPRVFQTTPDSTQS